MKTVRERKKAGGKIGGERKMVGKDEMKTEERRANKNKEKKPKENSAQESDSTTRIHFEFVFFSVFSELLLLNILIVLELLYYDLFLALLPSVHSAQ